MAGEAGADDERVGWSEPVLGSQGCRFLGHLEVEGNSLRTFQLVIVQGPVPASLPGLNQAARASSVAPAPAAWVS